LERRHGHEVAGGPRPAVVRSEQLERELDAPAGPVHRGVDVLAQGDGPPGCTAGEDRQGGVERHQELRELRVDLACADKPADYLTDAPAGQVEPRQTLPDTRGEPDGSRRPAALG
jgi:hypothetical protein